jgi:hypothetical protein
LSVVSKSEERAAGTSASCSPDPQGTRIEENHGERSADDGTAGLNLIRQAKGWRFHRNFRGWRASE